MKLYIYIYTYIPDNRVVRDVMYIYIYNTDVKLLNDLRFQGFKS